MSIQLRRFVCVCVCVCVCVVCVCVLHACEGVYLTSVYICVTKTITIIIDDGSTESFIFQHRKLLQSLGLGDIVAGLHKLSSGYQVIGLDTHPEIGDLPPPAATHG